MVPWQFAHLSPRNVLKGSEQVDGLLNKASGLGFEQLAAADFVGIQ